MQVITLLFMANGVMNADLDMVEYFAGQMAVPCLLFMFLFAWDVGVKLVVQKCVAADLRSRDAGLAVDFAHAHLRSTCVKTR